MAAPSARTRTVQELIDTEETYVKNLTFVSTKYIFPLRNTGMLSNKSIGKIFSNLETLLNLHRTFLSGLRAKFEAWDDVQQISDVFLELTPYFKLYTQYCMNYDNAIATLQAEKQVNEPFKFFLSATQEQDSNGAYITTYLIMPIQRIPRYEMLIGDLLKRTSSDHPDLGGLEKCLAAVNDIANFVNKECIKAECLTEVLAIGRELGMELAKSMRRVVKRGNADVRIVASSARHFPSSARPSTIVLFNDLLVFALPVKRGKCPPNVSFEVSMCWSFQDEQRDLHVATENMTAVLSFPAEAERDDWGRAILEAVANITRDSEEVAQQRQKYSMMKVNGVYKAMSAVLNENAGVPSSSRKRRWMKEFAFRELGFRKKRDSHARPCSATDDNIGTRRGVLGGSINVAAHLSAIPEVDVRNKRKSMPHYVMRGPVKKSADDTLSYKSYGTCAQQCVSTS